MAKYIEKEVAVKIAEKYGLTNGSVLGRHSGIADCIASEIATLPIVDVSPVVHGRWEQTEAPFMNECEDCSVCGYRTVWGHRFNYCPNCGAKMDGGADNG